MKFKNVKSTRTYKYYLVANKNITNLFTKAQCTQRLYFNYGLKFLYQHYDVNHLNSFFPTGIRRQYLIRRMKQFARDKSIQHNFNLKSLDFNIQSTDKMLEQLCINFDKYRKNQYKRINYWTDKDKQKYLHTHRTKLSGFMRISYKHKDNEIKSLTLKQNGNRIFLNNNYNICLPYFKNIQTKESMSNIKNKQIMEARIVKRLTHFELQIVVKFEQSKNVTKKDIDKIVGLDVNSAKDEIFVLSNNEIISWNNEIDNKYKALNSKSRELQNYITTHNHGNDNSNKTNVTKLRLNKIKSKMNNILDNWELNIAKYLSNKYPVIAIEQLNSFELRMSKRYNPRFRKNTNHKLAKIQPTTFKQYMENVYENDGHVLFEVNTIDTSKTCNYCAYINHDLKFEKQWKCPNCHETINRDVNAANNIRDWAINPKHHAVYQQLERFKYLNKKNLVLQF
jgi:putative transposase